MDKSVLIIIIEEKKGSPKIVMGKTKRLNFQKPWKNLYDKICNPDKSFYVVSIEHCILRLTSIMR